MNTFFTSDLHFSHINVLSYCNRPFKDVDEMNKHIIKVWNETVGSNDMVYIIGDFAMGPKSLHESYVKSLSGNLILISGNHELSFIAHKKREKGKEKLLSYGFKEVYEHLHQIKIGDIDVLLSHLPYKPSDHEASSGYDLRYMNYRPEDKGQWLLHGHSHCRYLKNRKQIDVGIDHNFQLYSEQDIINIMKDEREFIPSRLTDFYTSRKETEMKGLSDV